MPPHIDQNRSFQQRVNDFGPELGGLLSRVWSLRGSIDIANLDHGSRQIYRMYSGSSAKVPFSAPALLSFIAGLKALAGAHKIKCQELGVFLGDLGMAGIFIHRLDLWTDFFHVLATAKLGEHAQRRVYVHAANPAASLEIMAVIVGQFGSLGLREVKTCGPGSLRLDSIVAYLNDNASRDALVSLLLNTAKAKPALFNEALPALVKREGTGIGSADEPPRMKLFEDEKKAKHSFGSFYSALIWVALKNTPELGKPNADGRHMLDNVLYSLRLLRVDPRNPQSFPEAGALEQWYRASVRNP